MRKIQQISKDKLIESDAADTFLVKPFINTIENRNFMDSTGEMKVITGLTGQGKTWNTANVFIPTLFKEGVEIIHYTYPNLDVYDETMFRNAAKKHGYVIMHDLSLARRKMNFSKKPLKIVICATNQMMYVNNGYHLNELINSGRQFAFFSDEIHTWMVSSIDTYKETNGTPASPNYEATMYKFLSYASLFTPYIFGITATPNMEQFGEVVPNGKMKFNIINSLPPKELMVFKSAWKRETVFMDIKNDYDLYCYLERMMIDVKNDEIISGNKKSVLVHCTMEISDFPIWYVMSLMMEINRDKKLWDNDKNLFVCMTAKEKYYRNSKINGRKYKIKNDDLIKQYMNDQEDDATFLFIIEKGKCGMNIPNLKFMVNLRFTEKTTNDDYKIVHTNKQVMGRMVRINNGNVKLDTYGLEDGFLSGQLDKDQMLIDNAIQFYVPNTPSWVIADQEFEKNYVNTIEEAGRKINELMKGRMICE